MCTNPSIGYFKNDCFIYIGSLKGRKEQEFSHDYVLVPCGQCLECRLHRASEWALRCCHEMKSHDRGIFLTLTYNDDNLPSNGTLVKKHVQDFIKRLRRYIDYYGDGTKIRYLCAGEYGDLFFRPHYHLLVFGYYPSDPRLLHGLQKIGKNSLFTSPTLAKLWGKGHISFGAITFESARYTCQYALKKQTGENAAYYEERGVIPEFMICSNRNGIGYDFVFEHDNMFERGYLTMNGKKMGIPRYYQKICEREIPDYYATFKEKRRMSAPKLYEPMRLAARDEKLHKKVSLHRHSLEC